MPAFPPPPPPRVVSLPKSVVFFGLCVALFAALGYAFNTYPEWFVDRSLAGCLAVLYPDGLVPAGACQGPWVTRGVPTFLFLLVGPVLGLLWGLYQFMIYTTLHGTLRTGKISRRLLVVTVSVLLIEVCTVVGILITT